MVINLKQALEQLDTGGILIYPTDTIYGIGCLPEYINELIKIKPRKTGFIVIVDDFSKYIDWIDEDFSPLQSHQPTTWVVKASKKVPKALLNDHHIAIREVSHRPTKTLLTQLNTPLISTSANFPGQPTPTSVKELEKIFSFPILDGNNGGNKPSRIIHYRTQKIIRE